MITELITIELPGHANDLRIFSVYCPPVKPLDDNLIKLINEKMKSYILFGDLNARSKLLAPARKSNRNGNILAKLIESTNINIINAHTGPTYNSASNKVYYDWKHLTGSWPLIKQPDS